MLPVKYSGVLQNEKHFSRGKQLPFFSTNVWKKLNSYMIIQTNTTEPLVKDAITNGWIDSETFVKILKMKSSTGQFSTSKDQSLVNLGNQEQERLQKLVEQHSASMSYFCVMSCMATQYQLTSGVCKRFAYIIKVNLRLLHSSSGVLP